MFNALLDLLIYLLIDVLFNGVFRLTGEVVLHIATLGHVVPALKSGETPDGAKPGMSGFTYQTNDSRFIYAEYVPLVGVAFWGGVVIVCLLMLLGMHVAEFRY